MSGCGKVRGAMIAHASVGRCGKIVEWTERSYNSIGSGSIMKGLDRG